MHTDTAAPALPRLLTAAEIADLTGLPIARIYELVRIGSLPHVRLGRAVRFQADAVTAFFDNGGTGKWTPGS